MECEITQWISIQAKNILSIKTLTVENATNFCVTFIIYLFKEGPVCKMKKTSAAASEELSGQANVLQDLVSKFQLKNEEKKEL